MGEKRTRIEVTPEVTRQIATRRALGATLESLESEFGFSRPVVKRILGTELAREVHKGVIEDAVKGAISAVKSRLADMTELAMEALEHNLKEKKMEAVREYFAALGMKQAEKEQGTQQQAITVVLPGQRPPKDIDIEHN